ncbi:MAG: hypothetical protein K0R39_2301 [Symbiobacteriaceae bacterium]|jgi:hypothetical protein|nr:hypothetical protein [Symbiobacteriaceae bacterium]
MVSMLREIKHLASHASLTQSMKRGTRPMVEVYNKCLAAVQASGETEVVEFFQPLDPEKTNVDEVGTYAALLARYLKPRKPGSGLQLADEDEGDEEDEDED